jgi:hypothetical protein
MVRYVAKPLALSNKMLHIGNMITATNPAGDKILFDEENHDYFLPSGEKLAGVTSYIKKFFPVFDTQGISARYAAKHDMAQDDVIAMWADNRGRAAAMGHRLHAFAESVMNGERHPGMVDPYEHACSGQIIGFVGRLFDEFDLVACEKIVFSTKLMLAGTIDVLMCAKDNGRIFIGDWKTNRKGIKFENQWQSGLGPLANYPDCDFIHYCLQLNLYERLLVQGGYYPANTLFSKGIMHVNDQRVKPMVVPSMELEIDLMLQSELPASPAAA